MKGMTTQRSPSGNEWLPTVAQGLTGAGTTIADALVIPTGQDFSIVTTTGSGTGVKLPSTGVSVGEEYVVANHGANALAVYPGLSTGKMGKATAGTAYSLASGTTGYFTYCGSQQWTVNP